MDRQIKRVSFEKVSKFSRKRVAAYARVSSGKDGMLHSLAAQVSYFSALIQSNAEWEYCGVYSDEAITGTKETREGFQKLLTDCRDGKIDMVITKSISRFARNTVTLLEVVRELRELNVGVFFEEQNIHSLSSDGELMLTLLASFAQEESLSVSENMKWRIRKNFEEGMPWNATMLGYRMKDGHLCIVPDEAELVKRIYTMYLSGKGTLAITKELNAENLTTRLGYSFRPGAISKILKNYAYTGNLILQRTFRENHLTKRTLINEGQLPKYHVTDSHEAIVDLDTFNAVQKEMARRAQKYNTGEKGKPEYPFTGMIVCAKCGKHYRRKTTASGIVWICATYNVYGKEKCASKQIPETKLEEITADVDLGSVEKIIADDGNRLLICFKDGTEVERIWKDRSRSESWTDEMRKAAGKRAKERSKQ